MHSKRGLSYDHQIICDSTKDFHSRKTSLMRETNQESGVAGPKEDMLPGFGSRLCLITLFLFTAYGIFT